MAGTSLYHDSDDQGITDINVTPFVDVVLVLLVVFMVTAKLIVARGVEIDKPKAATGGEIQSELRISVKANGELYVNGTPYTDESAAIVRIQQIVKGVEKPKAIIQGDRMGAYENVMRAIDLAQKAGVTGIALENVRL
jgi:biopolymer transport protein ExbD